ncbi:hypothetical protein AMATHDRAFT_64920 [Amanita thiersii Skay4041]|uniref:amidase n=1 Tax=Amanita thiersii Skay4041 TaxID=703135 RepID=A0A2A9NEZ5_9AGAR|nr:hypothetical protein AMATHDRAFT_64920 [Amanita thiersii Skay4041]
MFFSSSYRKVVDAKQEQRRQALATAGGDAVAPAGHEEFLKATASQIVERIKKGEWTASQVLEAYIARAVLAQQTTNCLTEVMFEWARKQANVLDEEFASTGKLRGPLHGVPVSFKDHYDIAGVDTSVGFTQWANKPAEKHCDLAEQFLAAGAVLFVKTNIPQTMFAFECSNPLFGRSTNPFNDAYTPGGSSGGEGALLAMDGAALGVGSDIGGSLRIPAGYCGIYSLRPTSGRISLTGSRGPAPGFEGIKVTAGPMGRAIEDLELWCRLTFGIQGKDQDVTPLPFREVQVSKKLKFGYYTSDGFVKASPACQRAVLETVAALRKEGHECVEIELPDAVKALEIFIGLTSSDGYETMLSHLGPDPKEKALFLVSLGPSLPSFVRSFASWILSTVFGDPIFAGAAKQAYKKPMKEYMKFVEARNSYTKAFNEKVWERYSLDAIIAPVQAIPQMPHGGCDNYITLAAATILYNVLDCSVGVLPVTRVDPSKDGVTDEWINGPGHGSKLLELGVFTAKKAPLYNPETAKGMPVGIQVVGKRWDDEKVLGMMKVVDEALGGGGVERGFGPGNWDRYRKEGK